LLANVKIWEHDVRENYIVVQDWPEFLGVERCQLLILTSPVPYAYMGMMRKRGFEKLINLYEEHIEENRTETRYKTDLTGNIESLVYDGKSYPLHTVAAVKIINISKNGLRLYAKSYTLNMDDMFYVNIKIGENDKLLAGKVVNFKDVPPEHAEYGCRLVSEVGEQNL
jgi:hypothetical protein